MSNIQAYRGSILHFLRRPESISDTDSFQFIEDGLLIIESGKISKIDEFTIASKTLSKDIIIVDYSGYILFPGFIDTHIHFPQLEMIASYGEHLLEWLENYVFPTEKKYENKNYALKQAHFFVHELLRNGTTTAAAYSSVHKTSADMLFEVANEIDMCLITGKVMMDRNAPDYLLDTPESAYEDSKDLITKWHGKNRLKYAITPRFAPTSTEAQLEVAKTLKEEFPESYLQTHLSENKNELNWIKELYPWSIDYTDVYEKFDLLGDKSIFGHCIHLTDRAFSVIDESRSIVSWCPSSNFFLGSGFFNIKKAMQHDLNLSIGTDVGGGNRIFMLQVLNEAYKVASLSNIKLSPLHSLYYSTLGNAKALKLDKNIGNFNIGKDADFIVLDPANTPIMKERIKHSKTFADKLFSLQMLGDNRTIKATYIYGKLRYKNESIYI
jgi:guanine deaminase